MAATQPITRDDLTISHSVGAWGGPIATITFPARLIVDYDSERTATWRLSSTVGMDPIANDKHRILVDEGEDGRSWRGAFDTTDMDEAIDGLVEHLNALRIRQQIENRAPVVEFRDAVEAFIDSLGSTSRRNWQDEWAAVRQAATAVEMAMSEVTA
jgi:hypothetical protein